MQKPIHVEKPLENVVFKSLTMKTIHGRKIFHTWKEIEKIVAADRWAKHTDRIVFVIHSLLMQDKVGFGNNT